MIEHRPSVRRVVRFYLPMEHPYGCLSNFSRHPVDLDGQVWPTAEHYYQAQKFVGTPRVHAIRSAPSPMAAKTLARRASPSIRDDWDLVKESVMWPVVRRKFALHADVRAVLLSTGDALLVEASPTDDYWGCGADGTGLNRLGYILMETRALLRATESTTAGDDPRPGD